MAYRLHWTQAQIEQAGKDYTPGVAERLQKVFQDKERQLGSVHNPAALGRRFYNTFTLDGLKVAEIRFNVHGREFRAICVVLHDVRTVVLHALVHKNRQGEALAAMRRRSDEIAAAIREKVP